MSKLGTYTDHYAIVYDSIKGNRSADIELICRLVRENRPHTRHVLELGCGTGSVLQSLADSYHVMGLDNSTAMLTYAKRRIPEHTLYLADMADFHLGQKFDVIYCIHNSINHLTTSDKWVAMFDCVHAQLKSGGIFIFDFSTKEQMDSQNHNQISIWSAGDNYVLAKTTKHPINEGQFSREVRIFLQKDSYSFSYHHLTIDVRAFRITDILQMLTPNFIVLNSFILQQTKDIDGTGHTYFICQKT